MWRKIVGIMILCILFAGSVCGIVYGINYYNLKNSDTELQYKQLQVDYLNLQSRYDELVLQIENIDAQLYELNLENNSNKTLIEQLESEKTTLESEKSDLQSQITYLNELLSAYEDESKLKVILYVDDKVHDIVLVEENGTPDFYQVEDPTKEGYKFLYWSKDGETKIDLSTLIVTKDTNLYAVWQSYTLFSGKEDIPVSTSYYTSYTLDLGNHFDLDLSNINIQVTFDILVYSPLLEQAWQDGLVLKSGESCDFTCEYESAWKVNVKIDSDSIIVTPNNYAEGYRYSFVIYEILELEQ